MFVGDITALQQLTADVLGKPFHLFTVETRTPYHFALGDFPVYGHRYIEVPNETDALTIAYWLRAGVDGGAAVSIADIKGDRIAQLKGPSEAGLNRVQWNMRAGTGAGGGRGRGAGGPLLPAGDYRIIVDVGGQQQTTIGRIRERIVSNRP